MNHMKHTKVFILGESGQIGSVLEKRLIFLGFEVVNNEDDADIIALCTSSKVAKQAITEYLSNEEYTNKIVLNFSSTKIQTPHMPNIINGIGCSTLSVIKPLNKIKHLYGLIEDINVTVLFPKTAMSKQSKYNGNTQNQNIPIYIYEHKHQKEVQDITGLNINMSHFITQAEKDITTSITIKFKNPVNLQVELSEYRCFTRDEITWNIISVLDNLTEPIDYMIEKLFNLLKLLK